METSIGRDSQFLKWNPDGDPSHMYVTIFLFKLYRFWQFRVNYLFKKIVDAHFIEKIWINCDKLCMMKKKIIISWPNDEKYIPLLYPKFT